MADRQRAVAQLLATRRSAEALARALAGRWTIAQARAVRHANDLEPGRGRFFGRGATTWTTRQEGWYQTALAGHLANEKPSLLAMLVRYDRLSAAADDQARRIRLNEERTWDGSAHDPGCLRALRTALSETA